MEPSSGALDLTSPSLPDRPGIRASFPNNRPDLPLRGNPFQLKNHDDPLITLSTSSQPIPSTKAPSPYYHPEYPASNPSPSPGRHCPVPVAPDPDGLWQMNASKRFHDEGDDSDHGYRKRRRPTLPSGPVEPNEEEQLLLKLKEEENLPWKDISVRFRTDLGKIYQVPALQMRLKRLRERMRTWTETDVEALEKAYDYWERFQFDIIAPKLSTLLNSAPLLRAEDANSFSFQQMLDFGVSERWPAKYCLHRWEEFHPGRGPHNSYSNVLRELGPLPVGSPIDRSLCPRATL